MRAFIRSIRWEAEGINSYVLEPPVGEHLPEFSAGAHIEVRLANGLARSYSLANDPAERDRYEIAVQLSATSRGGSRYIHEAWRVGQMVEISEPRNFFALEENAPYSIFIAGGIGVTPFLSMIARLETLKRPWTLYYTARSRAGAAYLDRLEPYPTVNYVLRDEAPQRLDLAALIGAAPADAHLYCCGPARMLAQFEALTASRAEGLSHMEYFGSDTPAALEGGYRLELRRSGISLEVLPGETMLDALLMAGVNVGFACSDGVCGSCRVTVLDGIPDHRDRFLSAEQKSANDTVLVCCSGAKSPVLVLDL